ncbi:MAG: hypothetical protein H0V93_02785 [Euzebyales bacterium]|nr:hypothetical protein [Euzebyales bacterium]
MGCEEDLVRPVREGVAGQLVVDVAVADLRLGEDAEPGLVEPNDPSGQPFDQVLGDVDEDRGLGV